MDILSALLTKIFNLVSSKSAVQMWAQHSSPAPLIPNRPWASSFPFLWWSSKTCVWNICFFVLSLLHKSNLLVQLKKYFTFEVQVLDDKNVKRRFRASNYQSTTRVKPFICTMPMRLDEGLPLWLCLVQLELLQRFSFFFNSRSSGWNQIQFNLLDFTRRAYGTNYIETLRVQIHANCRIRRIYFSDRLYSEEELPAEFKLFLPIQVCGLKIEIFLASSSSLCPLFSHLCLCRSNSKCESSMLVFPFDGLQTWLSTKIWVVSILAVRVGLVSLSCEGFFSLRSIFSFHCTNNLLVGCILQPSSWVQMSLSSEQFSLIHLKLVQREKTKC